VVPLLKNKLLLQGFFFKKGHGSAAPITRYSTGLFSTSPKA
jgi:hypothetical protein